MYRFWLLSVIAHNGPSFRALKLNCSGLIPFYGFFMLSITSHFSLHLCCSGTSIRLFSDSQQNLGHKLNKPPHGRWALF